MQGEKRKVRIVAMSDTHDMHFRIDIASLPPGDIFIHSGDFTKGSSAAELLRFRQFLGLLPYKHKVVIAGNHDFALDRVGYEKSLKKKHQIYGGKIVNSQQEIEKLKKVCTYLEHQSVNIQGIKIFGSPYSLQFYDWGFMHTEEEGTKLWNMIPPDTQVLVTHGPPYGILDKNINKNQCGSKTLLESVLALKPKLHIFGHIHQAYGVQVRDGTTFFNASSTNFAYKLVNKPLVFEIQVIT